MLLEYQQRFPEVFQHIAAANNSSNDMFHELDVFPGPGTEDRVRELVTWLEAVPTHNAQRYVGTLKIVKLEIPFF